MTLTEQEAIRECKKLWKEIEESGETKGGFLFSLGGQKWRDKHYDLDCPLCEYAKQTPNDDVDDICANCPLMTQYNKGCMDLGFTSFGYSSPEFLKAIQDLKEEG